MFDLQHSEGNSIQQHFEQPRELLLVSSQFSMFLVAQTPALIPQREVHLKARPRTSLLGSFLFQLFLLPP